MGKIFRLAREKSNNYGDEHIRKRHEKVEIHNRRKWIWTILCSIGFFW